MKKENVYEKGLIIGLYAIVCAFFAFYELLSMHFTGANFDWNTYLYKVIFNVLITLMIFVLGYPDGKRDALKQEDFIAASSAYKSKLNKINRDGKNVPFRNHCFIFNNNLKYSTIEEIVTIRCGVEMSWLLKTEDELKQEYLKKEISKKKYKLLLHCKKQDIKTPYVIADKILTGAMVSDNSIYYYNESKEVLKILIPKFLMVLFTSALFVFQLSYNLEINANAIFAAVGSLISCFMAIIFSRNAGKKIIDKRKVIFIRWSDFIDSFENSPLTEKDKKILPNRNKEIAQLSN